MQDPTLQTPDKGTEPVVDPVIDPQPPAPVAPAPIDYSKKFSESTRENQRIMGELKMLEQQLGDITKVEIPTDTEMSKLYANWDTLGDFERDLAKKQMVLDRRMNNIHVGLGKITSTVEQTNNVTQFIKANASLVGKEDAFLEYAIDPAHRGTALNILLNSFLYEHPSAPAAPTVPPAPAPSPLQRGAPSGTGTPPTDSTTISDDEAESISKSDPKLYMEMVRDGRIK